MNDPSSGNNFERVYGILGEWGEKRRVICEAFGKNSSPDGLGSIILQLRDEATSPLGGEVILCLVDYPSITSEHHSNSA
jgi:hypothetical protein